MTIETESMPTRNAASQWLMTRRDGPGEEGACNNRERHPPAPPSMLWDQLLKRRSTVSCIVL